MQGKQGKARQGKARQGKARQGGNLGNCELQIRNLGSARCGGGARLGVTAVLCKKRKQDDRPSTTSVGAHISQSAGTHAPATRSSCQKGAKQTATSVVIVA